jgi:hypothetical protein
MEASQFIFNQSLISFVISWKNYAYHVLGFSVSTVTHLQKCGGNMNSASQCEVLLKLLDAIHGKLPGYLATSA